MCACVLYSRKLKSLVAISNWLVLLLYAYTCFDCQTDTHSHIQYLLLLMYWERKLLKYRKQKQHRFFISRMEGSSTLIGGDWCFFFYNQFLLCVFRSLLSLPLANHASHTVGSAILTTCTLCLCLLIHYFLFLLVSGIVSLLSTKLISLLPLLVIQD